MQKSKYKILVSLRDVFCKIRQPAGYRSGCQGACEDFVIASQVSLWSRFFLDLPRRRVFIEDFLASNLLARYFAAAFVSRSPQVKISTAANPCSGHVWIERCDSEMMIIPLTPGSN